MGVIMKKIVVFSIFLVLTPCFTHSMNLVSMGRALLSALRQRGSAALNHPKFLPYKNTLEKHSTAFTAGTSVAGIGAGAAVGYASESRAAAKEARPFSYPQACITPAVVFLQVAKTVAKAPLIPGPVKFMLPLWVGYEAMEGMVLARPIFNATKGIINRTINLFETQSNQGKEYTRMMRECSPE